MTGACRCNAGIIYLKKGGNEEGGRVQERGKEGIRLADHCIGSMNFQFWQTVEKLKSSRVRNSLQGVEKWIHMGVLRGRVCHRSDVKREVRTEMEAWHRQRWAVRPEEGGQLLRPTWQRQWAEVGGRPKKGQERQ